MKKNNSSTWPSASKLQEGKNVPVVKVVKA